MSEARSRSRQVAVVVGTVAFLCGLAGALIGPGVLARTAGGLVGLAGAGVAGRVLWGRARRAGRPGATTDRPGSSMPVRRNRTTPARRPATAPGRRTAPAQRRTTAPERRTPPARRPAITPQDPLTIRNDKEATELSLSRSGLVVRIGWARVGGGARWKPRLDLSWADVRHLGFDYGSHDSVVALYAVPVDGGGRKHVVDARTFAEPQWRQLAVAVAHFSGGRLDLDLARRDGPGPLRDS